MNEAKPIDAVYCSGCYYLLVGIGERGRCPECGGEFDVGTGVGCTRRPRGRRVWRVLRWEVYVVLVIGLTGGAGLGWLYRGWAREQETVAWVKKQGGTVMLDLIGPEWVNKHVGKRFGWLLTRAVLVRLEVAGPSKEGLKPLAGLEWLEQVQLGGAGVNDESIAALAAVESMTALSMWDARVTDAGLRRLGRRPGLRVLDLTRVPVTDEGLSCLGQFPGLTMLGLRNMKQLTGAGLVHVKEVSDLRALFMDGSAVGDVAVEPICGLMKLEAVDVRWTKMTEAGVKRLREALPGVWVMVEAVGQ